MLSPSQINIFNYYTCSLALCESYKLGISSETSIYKNKRQYKDCAYDLQATWQSLMIHHYTHSFASLPFGRFANFYLLLLFAITFNEVHIIPAACK